MWWLSCSMTWGSGSWDLFPTVLDVAGVEVPGQVDGVAQQPVNGASLRATFDDADAPGPRDTQYFELLGSRSIVHGRWKATTDVSGEHPQVVAELRQLWQAEAERNQVLPIGDGLMSRLDALIWPAWPAGDDRVFRAGAGPVCDESVPMLAGGFLFTAAVDAAEHPSGVLFALGDHNAGYALFVADERLVFTLSRAGELLEVVAGQPLALGPQSLSVGYTTESSEFTLFHGQTPVGRTAIDGAVPFTFQHGGAGLRLGFDSGLPVSPRYAVPFAWNGGLTRVRLRVPGPPVPDPGDVVRAAIHSE